MTGKQLEKLLKINLLDFFSRNGYSYFHKYENTYFSKKSDLISSTLEVQSKSRSIGYSEFSITFWEIEKILLEIGHPQLSNDRLKETFQFSTTVYDRNLLELLKYDKLNPVETEDDCLLFCQRIIDYIENQGKAFIERFSYLPNVLTEMDRLEQDGKYWTGIRGKGGILSGMGEAFYRGLIISKLCNDQNYDKKVELVRHVFEEDKVWLNNFFLLVEKLKVVTPLYNV